MTTAQACSMVGTLEAVLEGARDSMRDAARQIREDSEGMADDKKYLLTNIASRLERRADYVAAKIVESDARFKEASS